MMLATEYLHKVSNQVWNWDVDVQLHQVDRTELLYTG